jgi:glutathione S-transferase
MMKLFQSIYSQHARKIRVFAREVGLEIQEIDVDLGKGASRMPEYLAKNPNGKVPVLDHDGFMLWESNAILTYLADVAPGGTKLYPEDKKLRADVNRWLFWENAHFNQATLTLSWERMAKPIFRKEEPDAALVAHGEALLKRYAPVLNAALEGKSFVTANDQLSLADIALSCQLMYRGPAGIDLAPYKNIQAWIDRMEARESMKKTNPMM